MNERQCSKSDIESFEYLILSFGLINISMIFQRYINQILRKELKQEKIEYVNNILITEKIIEEYRSKIRRILIILLKTELKVKLFKCEIEQEEVTFSKYHIE